MENQVSMTGEYKINSEEDGLSVYLEKFPFITIIGKYDHILGPSCLYTPVEYEDENFIKNLLRDALNTKNKFVILNHDKFYSQTCKVRINDEDARGRNQLYAIILLRHIEKPLIPTVHFKKIEMLFRKVGEAEILKDNINVFDEFARQIRETYFNKDELLPLESCNLKVRSGVNTIQGFCELILEEKTKRKMLSDEMIIDYVNLMLDSCDEIIKALEENLQGSFHG
ncbi:MAG: hypothetical protein GF311_21360 [Candidatus Lokiarchaeota archaeon]|nr:hypothetical protein [Candidatus Lokiarchaeota archaeon]